jgi:uncharacterized membrane-anchored protein
MKNKKHLAFLWAIVLFVVVLASGVYIQEDLRHNGQQVILATIPVDPRDILRGDYVDLAYEIGRSEKATAFAETFEQNQPIYTLLTLGEDGRVKEYSFTSKKPKDGVYIRGEVVIHEFTEYMGERDGEPVYETKKNGNIRYPQIEQYFVPEGKGWVIDRMGRIGSGSKIEVKIALGKYGRAQILQLLVDGEPIDFSQIESENPWTDEPVGWEPKPVAPPAEKV